MIEHAVTYIQQIISTYGVWGVFVATLMEEIISPIPSALVPLASGFFLLSQAASWPVVLFDALFVVALPVAVGISLGSSAAYYIAYYGGKPLIEKNQKWLGITWEDVERIERRVVRGKRDEVTLVALRLVPVIPGVALSAFCGIVRYPFTTFLATTFFGSGARAFCLALIGWQAGEFYLKYLDLVSRIEKYLFTALIIVLALVAVWYLISRQKKRVK